MIFWMNIFYKIRKYSIIGKMNSIWKIFFFFPEQQILYREDGKNIPFILKFENICGIIERKKNERGTYIYLLSILENEIFDEIEERMLGDSGNLRKIIDSKKIQIDSKQELPLNEYVYFKDLIVGFGMLRLYNLKNMMRKKLDVRVISGEILLKKKSVIV